jgi:hypothetical protein
MKKIFVCSPFAGEVDKNVRIAKHLCRMVMDAGHAPFAPHLLYPRFTDDAVPAQRAAGIACGLAFMETCDEVWAFTGNDVSSGMRQEIEHAERLGKPVIRIAEV